MRILAIASSIGGTGKTTTSVALAAAFQRLGFRTALIDFDIGLGKIERLIGPAHLGPDLLDAIDTTGPLALGLVPGSYTGELLVIPSSRMSDKRVVTPRQIQRLFECCEASGLDYIICDLPPGLGEPSLGMADLADDILLTSPADMPLTHTVSPLLYRLRAGRPRAGKACRLHLLITRSTSRPGTPDARSLDIHFPGREQLTLLGVVPEVEAAHCDSGSGYEVDPLMDEGLLTAYAGIAARLLHITPTMPMVVRSAPRSFLLNHHISLRLKRPGLE